jgi:hypothetical protein
MELQNLLPYSEDPPLNPPTETLVSSLHLHILHEFRRLFNIILQCSPLFVKSLTLSFSDRKSYMFLLSLYVLHVPYYVIFIDLITLFLLHEEQKL